MATAMFDNMDHYVVRKMHITRCDYIQIMALFVEQFERISLHNRKNAATENSVGVEWESEKREREKKE